MLMWLSEIVLYTVYIAVKRNQSKQIGTHISIIGK